VIFGIGSASAAGLEAAIEAGASWHFLEQGRSGYQDGFQTPPTCWELNTDSKKTYFGRLAELTGLAEAAKAPAP
jgi:hypothetical protein